MKVVAVAVVKVLRSKETMQIFMEKIKMIKIPHFSFALKYLHHL